MSRKVINIFEEIGENFWGEGMSDTQFNQLMNEAEASEEDGPILININSVGGSIKDGIAIANRISSSSQEVVTTIVGHAWSMASIIAMHGNTVKMAKNGTLMIHNCWGGARGNASDLRQTAEMMDKVDGGLAESIAAKSGLTKDEVLDKYLDYKDHTLSAQEAKDAGLIDEVVPMQVNDLADFSNMSASEAYAKYHKLNSKNQKGFMNKMLEQVKDQVKETIKNLKPNNTPIMDLKELKGAIEGDKFKNLSDDEKSALLAEIKSIEEEGKEFTQADIDAAVKTAQEAKDDEITQLNDKVKTLEDAAAGDGGATPLAEGGDKGPEGEEEEEDFRGETDAQLDAMLKAQNI